MLFAVVALFLAGSYIIYGDFRSGWFRLGGYQLIAEQYYVDLGSVSAGESKVGVFRLKNLTGKPIALLGVEVDCGCLATVELPLVVPARKSAGFEVVFSAGNVASEREVVHRMVLNVDVDQPIQVLSVKVMVIPNRKEN